MSKLVETIIALTLISIYLLALFIVGKRIHSNYVRKIHSMNNRTRIKVVVGILIYSVLLLITYFGLLFTILFALNFPPVVKTITIK